MSCTSDWWKSCLKIYFFLSLSARIGTMSCTFVLWTSPPACCSLFFFYSSRSLLSVTNPCIPQSASADWKQKPSNQVLPGWKSPREQALTPSSHNSLRQNSRPKEVPELCPIMGSDASERDENFISFSLPRFYVSGCRAKEGSLRVSGNNLWTIGTPAT